VSRQARAGAVTAAPEEAMYFVDAWRWAQTSECNCFTCWVLREKMSGARPELLEEWKRWKRKK